MILLLDAQNDENKRNSKVQSEDTCRNPSKAYPMGSSIVWQLCIAFLVPCLVTDCDQRHTKNPVLKFSISKGLFLALIKLGLFCKDIFYCARISMIWVAILKARDRDSNGCAWCVSRWGI